MKAQLLTSSVLGGIALTLASVTSASSQEIQQRECAKQIEEIEQRIQEADLPQDQFEALSAAIEAAYTIAESDDRGACNQAVQKLEQIVQTSERTGPSGAASASQEQDRQTSEQKVSASDEGAGRPQPSQQQVGQQQPLKSEDPEAAPSAKSSASTAADVTARVAIDRPEPEVVVRQEPPKVKVDLGKPIITITMPEPQIEVQMPDPKVQLEQSDPQIQVVMADQQSQSHGNASAGKSEPQRIDARVQMETERRQPEIDVSSQKPEVRVNQQEPQVQVAKADPSESAPTANGSGDKAMADSSGNQDAADPSGNKAIAAQVNTSESSIAKGAVTSPLIAFSIDQLRGYVVVNENGDTIAEIIDLVKDSETAYAVLSVGGFLGIGDKEVAIALEEFEVVLDDQIVLPAETEEGLESMPEFDKASYQPIRS